LLGVELGSWGGIRPCFILVSIRVRKKLPLAREGSLWGALSFGTEYGEKPPYQITEKSMSRKVEEWRQRLFDAIADGQTVPWETLLAEKAGDEQAILKALVFGQPLSVGRKGNTFTAKGAVAAEMPPLIEGIKVHSEKEVHFTINPTGLPVKMTDIDGITVTAPVIGTFPLTHTRVDSDRDGNILLSSSKLLVWITLIFDPAGGYKTWRLGK
jgi:hypothetical protein